MVPNILRINRKWSRPITNISENNSSKKEHHLKVSSEFKDGSVHGPLKFCVILYSYQAIWSY